MNARGTTVRDQAPRALTEHEVAELLGLSVATLRAWRHRGKGPRRERELVEEAGHGRLAADEQGPKRLSDAINAYLAAKRIRCSPRTIELEEERLSLVKKHFGDVTLSAITGTSIAEFQRTRHEAGIANRTINMDVGVLSRVLKSCGRWRALADRVHNLPERQHPVGRALTADERKRLFHSAASIRNGSTSTAQRSSRPTPRCGPSR